MDLSRRPVTPEDEPFLRELYARTHGEALILPRMPEQQAAQILDLQFRARMQGYRAAFPEASWSIVCRNGSPVGVLIVDDGPDLHLIDIRLLPAEQGNGIGGRLMAEFLGSARERGKSATLEVEHGNPARRLYERLGFREISRDGFRASMRWEPSPANLPSSETA